MSACDQRGASMTIELSEVLRSRRAEQGLSQFDIANVLRVTQQTVSRWESGEAVPRPRRLAELAAVLGLSPAYLMKVAGHVVPDASSPAQSKLHDLLETIDELSQEELVLLLDTVWTELRTRIADTAHWTSSR